MDVVFLGEPIERGDKGCSVVRDDLLESSPSTQNFFENKTPQSPRCLLPQLPPLWPTTETTTSVNDILES